MVSTAPIGCFNCISGRQEDLDNSEAAVRWFEAYLHMSDGMYFADEEVNGQHTPSRGTEVAIESTTHTEPRLDLLCGGSHVLVKNGL